MTGTTRASAYLRFAAPVTALAMLVAIALPARIWTAPAEDAVYRGFDARLIYVSEGGYNAPPTDVSIAADRLRITARPESHPIVHLVTTPISVRVAMDVRIMQPGSGAAPLRLTVWSPRTGSGHVLEFGGAPSYRVTASTVIDGRAGVTLMGGRAVRSATLGRYAPGRPYHVELLVDRVRQRIEGTIAPGDREEPDRPMLRLIGGPNDPRYSDVASRAVAVRAGAAYAFGATVAVAAGSDAYKLSLFWYDAQQRLLAFSNGWRSVDEIAGRSRRTFRATAPPRAATARLFLGSGNDTTMLFTDMFLREAARPGPNLLPNGNLRDGLREWRLVQAAARPPELITPSLPAARFGVGPELLPDLFPPHRLPLTLTVTAASASGATTSELTGYSVHLPHQRWLVTRITDARARLLVSALLMTGLLLITIRLSEMMRERRRRRSLSDNGAAGREDERRRTAGDVVRLPLWAAVGSLGAVGLLNALLFSLGSLPFDMGSARVWAYIATAYGPMQLYHLPNLVSLAQVWNGAPYHEAIFPYGPPMAYLFTAVGWAYRLLLNGPGPLALDAFALEFVVKGTTLLFFLGGGVLVYVILAEAGAGRRRSALGAILYLCNPALWFAGSIWGQTQAISLLLVLGAIYAGQRSRLTVAWLLLGMAVLTRPQIIAPAALFGVILLRRYPPRVSLAAIPWSVIMLFLMLAPFLLAVGPSVPADVLRAQFLLQAAGLNEPELTTVSLDAHSVWPLVTWLRDGAHGLARFAYPSTFPLLGTLDYGQVSNLVTVLLFVIPVALALWRSADPAGGKAVAYPILALGVVAFLMVKTGLAAPHFVIALPFLILCLRWARPAVIVTLVLAWTATTLVATYGSFGLAVAQTPAVAPALDPSRNTLTVLMIMLHQADGVITAAVLANLAVLSALVVVALRGVVRHPPRTVQTSPKLSEGMRASSG